MELREALERIAEIRQRLAEAELFRGYRSLPAALTGVLALLAGLLQPLVVGDPVQEPFAFVLLWSGVAALGLAASLAAMWLRDRALGGERSQSSPRVGLAPMLPCLLAGAGVTGMLLCHAPEAAWLLPGLWQVLYSQGLFAACRTLPRALGAVPAFYLLSGLATLGLARGPLALSPLAMALPFGFGQLLAAVLLYRVLERHDREEITTDE
jgi:hypothetical protein